MDWYREIASQLFNVDEGDVSDVQRTVAKSMTMLEMLGGDAPVDERREAEDDVRDLLSRSGEIPDVIRDRFRRAVEQGIVSRENYAAWLEYVSEDE